VIDEIQVQNLALIREATLEPARGLTVLTGETGAGKSALLSALKLLMGVRASADAVRDGEEGLMVSGRFFGLKTPEGIAGDDADKFAVDDETVVTRKVNAQGRSRASVNGTMASARELTALVAPSIDLCGQFEHQQLMRPATHVSLLDAWAGADVDEAREADGAALQAAREAEAFLAHVKEVQESSSAKLDDARFTLSRIDEVNRKFDALVAQAKSKMVSEGTYNSTVWPTTVSGIERDRQIALNDLKDDMVTTKIDVLGKIAAMKADIVQKLLDCEIRIIEAQQKMLLGPTEIRNTVFKWMLEFMERREDDYPGREQLATIASQLGYAEGGAAGAGTAA